MLWKREIDPKEEQNMLWNRTNQRREEREMVRERSKPIWNVVWATAILFGALCFSAGVAMAATPSGTEIKNTATVNYTDVSLNSFSAVSNETTVTVTSVFGVSLDPVPVNQAVPSNTVAYYSYILTNTGNDNNTFALSALSGAGVPSWTVALYADDGAGAGGVANDGIHQTGETNVTPSTGLLAGDGTYRFFLAVTVPASTPSGTTDNSVLTVTGADSGGADDTTHSVITTAQAPAMSVVKNVRNVSDNGSFAIIADAAPLQILEYQIAVTNNGTIDATSVVLTDLDQANTTYVANSIWIGSNGADSGAPNLNRDDNAIMDGGEVACGSDACGHANASGGNITAYLGTGATELIGGSLTVNSTVYVYFQVTVD